MILDEFFKCYSINILKQDNSISIFNYYGNVSEVLTNGSTNLFEIKDNLFNIYTNSEDVKEVSFFIGLFNALSCLKLNNNYTNNILIILDNTFDQKLFDSITKYCRDKGILKYNFYVDNINTSKYIMISLFLYLNHYIVYQYKLTDNSISYYCENITIRFPKHRLMGRKKIEDLFLYLQKEQNLNYSINMPPKSKRNWLNHLFNICYT